MITECPDCHQKLDPPIILSPVSFILKCRNCYWRKSIDVKETEDSEEQKVYVQFINNLYDSFQMWKDGSNLTMREFCDSIEATLNDFKRGRGPTQKYHPKYFDLAKKKIEERLGMG